MNGSDHRCVLIWARLRPDMVTDLDVEPFIRYDTQPGDSDAFCHVQSYSMRFRCPSSFRKRASVVSPIWNSGYC